MKMLKRNNLDFLGKLLVERDFLERKVRSLQDRIKKVNHEIILFGEAKK